MVPSEFSNADRVLIATDALAWLRAGALRAAQGVYLRPISEASGTGLLSNLPGRMQLRDAVLGPCSVCAAGALFIAAIVRHDNCTISQFKAYTTRGFFVRWFGSEQAAEVETAFERNVTFGGSYAAEVFGCRFLDSGERLAAILQNMIDHGGRFVPDKRVRKKEHNVYA
jgi:hypothetical protein